jgi:hypothetical protein
MIANRICIAWKGHCIACSIARIEPDGYGVGAGLVCPFALAEGANTEYGMPSAYKDTPVLYVDYRWMSSGAP